MFPDVELADNELQIAYDSPVGMHEAYDLYPGIYLGREVWCKYLYGNPNGKAMVVRTPPWSFASQLKSGPLKWYKREVDIWSKLWRKDQEQRRLEDAPPRVLPVYGFYAPHAGTT